MNKFKINKEIYLQVKYKIKRKDQILFQQICQKLKIKKKIFQLKSN